MGTIAPTRTNTELLCQGRRVAGLHRCVGNLQSDQVQQVIGDVVRMNDGHHTEPPAGSIYVLELAQTLLQVNRVAVKSDGVVSQGGW